MPKVYKKIEFFSILLIVVLALILRLYRIDNISQGFFCDEAANGYNAYKLSTTGRDEYGNFLPFYFRSFGDYRNPVSIYVMIPSVVIFGLSEFSVRLTMAILGTATVFLIFLFTREFFYKLPLCSKILLSLSAAFYLAISPWHIHFSRTGFEFTTLPFFLTLSLFFLFRFLRQEEEPRNNSKFSDSRYLLLSTVSFIITFYTYYPIQLVLIPFLLGIFFIYKDILFSKRNRVLFFSSLFIFIIGLLPFVCGVNKGTALSRFSNVSPLAKSKDIKDIKVLIMPILKTYLGHFSLDFLFKKGDVGMFGHFITRHSIKGMGELYLFQLPLLLIGFFVLAFDNLRNYSFLLLWLILYPIGSTVVGEGPFAHRSIFGVIPFQIIIGYGTMIVFNLIGKIKLKVSKLGNICKLVIIGILILIFSNSVSQYFFKYFYEYPSYSSDFWGWQYGPNEIMKYFLSVKDNYDDLYMSGEFNAGEIFLKFYDPQNSCQGKCKMGDFRRNPQIYNSSRSQIFSLSPEYLENSSFKSQFSLQKTIYYPNGKIAFLIGNITPVGKERSK